MWVNLWMIAGVGEWFREWANKRIYSLVGGIFLGDLYCDRREERKEEGMDHCLFSHSTNIQSSGFWGPAVNKTGMCPALRYLPYREWNRHKQMISGFSCHEEKGEAVVKNNRGWHWGRESGRTWVRRWNLQSERRWGRLCQGKERSWWKVNRTRNQEERVEGWGQSSQSSDRPWWRIWILLRTVTINWWTFKKIEVT